VKGHMSFDDCKRCQGEKHDNITVFLDNNCTKCTDIKFCNFIDINHHTRVSALIYVELHINMISHFVIDVFIWQRSHKKIIKEKIIKFLDILDILNILDKNLLQLGSNFSLLAHINKKFAHMNS